MFDSYTPEQFMLFEKVFKGLGEAGNYDVTTLLKKDIEDIPRYEIVLDDWERDGLFKVVHAEKQSDLKADVSILGKTRMEKFFKAGGGYILETTLLFNEERDNIAKHIRAYSRIKNSSGVWYELRFDTDGLVMLNHYHGTAKVLKKIYDESNTAKLLNLLFARPNKTVTLNDMEKERPRMTKNLLQTLNEIEAFKKYPELKNMFFPIFSNKRMKLTPKIYKESAETLNIETLEYLGGFEEDSEAEYNKHARL